MTFLLCSSSFNISSFPHLLWSGWRSQKPIAIIVRHKVSQLVINALQFAHRILRKHHCFHLERSGSLLCVLCDWLYSSRRLLSVLFETRIEWVTGRKVTSLQNVSGKECEVAVKCTVYRGCGMPGLRNIKNLVSRSTYYVKLGCAKKCYVRATVTYLLLRRITVLSNTLSCGMSKRYSF